MTAHIHSWTDGYLALRERVVQTRGLVELDTGARWPRTTGGDVIAIAALFDAAVRANGTLGVVRRWRGTLADLEREALTSSNETYPENRTFWASLEMAAIFLDDLAVTPPAPSLWDALLDHVGTHATRNAGPHGDGPFKHFDVPTYSDLYIEQFKYLRDLRGFDNKDPEPGMGGANKPIPRTLNGDVVLLADYWGKQLADVKDVFGHESVEKQWKQTADEVNAIARKGDPNAVYPKNNGFWRVLSNTAIHVSVADEAPSKSDMMLDSLKHSVTHLPETLEHAASKGADFVASAAHAVGKVANEAGKGLFSGFGTPLLIGAGLIGLFLISRSRHGESEA
jgi:hypothetical protein